MTLAKTKYIRERREIHSFLNSKQSGRIGNKEIKFERNPCKVYSLSLQKTDDGKIPLHETQLKKIPLHETQLKNRIT